jgi:hypothetical protein
MKFTAQIKEKIYKIIDDSFGGSEYKVDILENKGYSLVKISGRYNTKTRRFSWGKKPSSSSSTYYFIGEARLPTNMRIRYWLELPNEFAEKILILGYFPDCTNSTI